MNQLFQKEIDDGKSHVKQVGCEEMEGWRGGGGGRRGGQTPALW